jgi:Uma2 family endonuclease
MSPVGCQHGGVVAQLLFLLKQYQQRKPVGRVFTEVGFKLATKPDTVRAPDVAFVRLERFPSPEPQGFFQGPPDLAVEVISPDDRPSDVRSKVEEYLSRGVPLVVVVDPSDRSVTSFRRLTPPSQLRQPDDRLDLGDVVPGFSCRLQEIFEA